MAAPVPVNPLPVAVIDLPRAPEVEERVNSRTTVMALAAVAVLVLQVVPESLDNHIFCSDARVGSVIPAEVANVMVWSFPATL